MSGLAFRHYSPMPLQPAATKLLPAQTPPMSGAVVSRCAPQLAPREGGQTQHATVSSHGPPAAAGGFLPFLRHATTSLAGHVANPAGPLHSGLVAALQAASDTRTFRCPFCMENVSERQRVVFSACGDANHGVCKACAGHYIRSLVSDGRINAVGCHECGAKATTDEVLRLTDRETCDRMIRFRQIHEDPQIRECPQCSRLCQPTLDADGHEIAAMRCVACGAEFCYYHSNAHTGSTCEEYRVEIDKLDRLAEKGAMKGTKTCPQCGIVTDRAGGCQHMTCKRCGSEWCWSCGELLEGGGGGVTEHYAFGNCNQFEDENPGGPLAIYFRCLAAPLRVLSIVLFIFTTIVVLVVFLALMILYCVFICPVARCLGRAGDSGLRAVIVCALTVGYFPFIPFLLLCVVYVLIFWSVARPCGATRQHFMNLCMAPLLSPLSVVHLLHLTLQRHVPDENTTGSDSESGSDSGGSRA